MKFLIITLATFATYLALNALAMFLTWFANTVSLWGILAVVAAIVLAVKYQRRKKSPPESPEQRIANHKRSTHATAKQVPLRG